MNCQEGRRPGLNKCILIELEIHHDGQAFQELIFIENSLATAVSIEVEALMIVYLPFQTFNLCWSF